MNEDVYAATSRTLKTCRAKTRARELNVCIIGQSKASGGSYRSRTFSPPDKFEIFFQLFFGGMTLKMMPSENGSMLSTNSSSALPPRVIILAMCKQVMLGIIESNRPDTSPST